MGDYAVSFSCVFLSSQVQRKSDKFFSDNLEGYVQVRVSPYLGRTRTSCSELCRQVFDTVKWAGFFTTLGLLLSFLAVYVTAHAYHLRSLAKNFRSRLFPDRFAIEMALQQEGISLSSEELSAVIDSTSDLDQFAVNIQNLTGQKLSPEDLLRISSGATLEQIIQRLSYATSLSPEAVAAQLKDASSIGELIEDLHLDQEGFLDIITQDEQVKNFQNKIAGFIQPMKRETSSITFNDDIDIKSFRERIQREMN